MLAGWPSGDALRTRDGCQCAVATARPCHNQAVTAKAPRWASSVIQRDAREGAHPPLLAKLQIRAMQKRHEARLLTWYSATHRKRSMLPTLLHYKTQEPSKSCAKFATAQFVTAHLVQRDAQKALCVLHLADNLDQAVGHQIHHLHAFGRNHAKRKPW